MVCLKGAWPPSEMITDGKDLFRMTIERINDHQIRATLTRDDFEDRHLRLAELVMGSEKARDLLKDLMQQAYIEHGFETDEKFPLMIEAIPVSKDCLILVITRVEDPDEFEDKFSRFNKLISNEIDMDPGREDHLDAGAENEEEDSEEEEGSKLMQFFNDLLRKKFMEDESSAEALPGKDAEEAEELPAVSPEAENPLPERSSSRKKPAAGGSGRIEANKKAEAVHMFSFSSMNTVSSCCALIEPFFNGSSALYKNPYENDYLLVLHRPEEDDGAYDRSCHLVCDFGFPIHHTDALESYFKEHYRVLLGEDAVKTLSTLA